MARPRKAATTLAKLQRYAEPLTKRVRSNHLAILIALFIAVPFLYVLEELAQTGFIPPTFMVAHEAFLVGNSRYREGKVVAATDSYLEALRWFPDYSVVWQTLGNALREIAYHPFSGTQLSDAVQTQMNGVECMSFRGRARYNLGLSLYVEGDYLTAIDAYKAALLANPYMVDAWYGLSWAYQDISHYGSALRALQRALRVMPRHHEARLAYCNLLYTMNNIDGCFHCFRELITMHPHSARGMVAMGMIYQDIGQYEAAKILYRTALETAPGHLVAGTRYAAVVGMRNFYLGKEYLYDLFNAYTLTNDKVMLKAHINSYELLYDAISAYVEGTGFRILDLGCGTGLLCPVFRDLAAEIVGVDESSTMAVKARARDCYDQVFVEDIHSFQYGYREQFDIVILADVLPYFSNITSTLLAAYELVHESGLVAFTLEATETMDRVEAALLATEEERSQMLQGLDGMDFCWGSINDPYSSRPHAADTKASSSDSHDINEPQLQITARFAHSVEYLADVLGSLPFVLRDSHQAVLRSENGVPVCGYVVVVQASDDGVCDIYNRVAFA